MRKVNFLSEQDGTPERELKARLGRVFEANPGLWRAYLARIDYGDGGPQNVALCLIAASGLEKENVEQVGSVFRSLFKTEERLDILFLRLQQEAELSLVCLPLYVTKAKARDWLPVPCIGASHQHARTASHPGPPLANPRPLQEVSRGRFLACEEAKGRRCGKAIGLRETDSAI